MHEVSRVAGSSQIARAFGEVWGSRLALWALKVVGDELSEFLLQILRGYKSEVIVLNGYRKGL